ncbi:hypothetical protein GALL_507930 [mine drainage metagenome]|uniref:Uncharacterized protein n=1 Tax=mine drainage metagenome TaxID=410659 RepID=A0A1J5PJB8_9ZZZZ
MEFEALDAEFLDQLPRLANAKLAFMRIDAGEGYQHIGIFGGDLEHLVIIVAAETGFPFGVDRKDHRGDLLGAVVGRGLLHSRRMFVRRLEVLGHLRLEVVIAVVTVHPAGLFGMGVDVDCHDVFDIGQLQSGHFRFSRRAGWIVQPKN